jgi:hypothetical protein
MCTKLSKKPFSVFFDSILNVCDFVLNNNEQIKHISKVEQCLICFDGSNYPFINKIHSDLCSLIEV